MKIVGIIAEYNPFHRGHEFHIKKAKELTGADAVIVVMSGDYVQRGMPAILPKHLRAEMALSCGADGTSIHPCVLSIVSLFEEPSPAPAISSTQVPRSTLTSSIWFCM